MNVPRLGHWLGIGLAAILAHVAAVRADTNATTTLFPFVLPWDDDGSCVANVSGWLDKPAGRNGFVVAKDGHLFVGDKRIRFFGVNVCFGADFPKHEDAGKIAARMAKFGINCVRFHHMDMQVAPSGIFSNVPPSNPLHLRALDPQQLDKLDYFVAQLKKNGIYADLNLHVSRTYPGLPTGDGVPTFDKGVDNFHPRMIELQREYARDLLTHFNPYTKTRYIEEPAVAFIEINNENALFHEWWRGSLDAMPAEFAAELARQWNAWLRAEYPNDVALKKAWAVQDEPLGGISIFRKRDFSGRTDTAQRDWIRFLWDTEERYWTSMYRFLKDDLKARELVIGTQVGYSPSPIQAKLDVMDVHGYWQHPHFPGKQWDPANWIVQNVSMAADPNGGILPGMALWRVADKPYICTEYNHPAPNTYSSEAFLLLSAYAALQDWDGIFVFAYSHRHDDWDLRRIPSFFDIDQHPTKMVTLPAGVAMFTRGDVAPAQPCPSAAFTTEEVIEKLRRGGPWSAKPRTEATVTGGALIWSNGVVTVNASRSRAVVGFLRGQVFDLGNVRIAPGATRQDWAAITVTEMAPGKWLITATGYAENTEMGWKNAERSTVGKYWGHPPSLVEGVPATIELPVAAKLSSAWALDERGQRKTELAVREGEIGALIDIGPQHQTLWYEVETREPKME